MSKKFRFLSTAIGAILIASLFPIVSAQSPPDAQSSNSTAAVQKAPAQIRSLKVTLLSTMLVGSTTGLGEWGFRH